MLWLVAITLVGCGPAAAPVPQVRFVHVAWPGRPVSDAMDREVLDAPAFAALIARGVVFERTTVELADAGVRDVVGGLGTVAFVDGVLAGRRRGASSLRGLRSFVGLVSRAARDRSAVTPRHWLDVGLPERALAALAAGPAAEAEEATGPLALRVEALLALGDVAAARRELDRAPPGAGAAVPEASVRIAERRPRDAVLILEGADRSSTEHAFWLGRALLDCGERERAYAALEDAARGDGPLADQAADLLGTAITGGDGHSHR